MLPRRGGQQRWLWRRRLLTLLTTLRDRSHHAKCRGLWPKERGMGLATAFFFWSLNFCCLVVHFNLVSSKVPTFPAPSVINIQKKVRNPIHHCKISHLLAANKEERALLGGENHSFMAHGQLLLARAC